METHHIEMAVREDGNLALKRLPLRDGDDVEVIIIEQKLSKNAGYSLRGKPIHYDNPTAPLFYLNDPI